MVSPYIENMFSKIIAKDTHTSGKRERLNFRRNRMRQHDVRRGDVQVRTKTDFISNYKLKNFTSSRIQNIGVP